MRSKSTLVAIVLPIMVDAASSLFFAEEFLWEILGLIDERRTYALVESS